MLHTHDAEQAEGEIERLRKSEATLFSAAQQSAIDLFEYDPLTGIARILSNNAVLPAWLFGQNGRCVRFLDKLASEGFVMQEDEVVLRSALAEVAKGAGRNTCEIKVRARDGSLAWAQVVLSSKGAGQCVVGVMENITQQKETLHHLINETQFYQAVLSEQDAYAQVDVTEDRIARAGGLWNLYNELKSTMPYSQLAREFFGKVVHPEDRAHYAELMQRENFIESFESGVEQLGCEFRCIVDQNRMTWMRLSAHLFRDPFTQHILALLCIKDIDDKKKQEMLLLRDSTRDQLTNIYNKKMAQKAISDYVSAVSPEEHYAFVILDLDDFKDINDLQGHEAGDRALIHLANTLGRTFRKDDIIGRFGGDEFIVFLKNITSKEWVGECLADLYQDLRLDADIPLACSGGVVYASGPGSYERLFRRADIALYAAKGAGKGCFKFADDLDAMDLWQKLPQEPSSAAHRGRTKGSLFAGNEEHESLVTASSDFDAFVGCQGDIAYVVDTETYELMCGNSSFYNRLGITAEQCRGRTCYEVMQDRETPCPFCGKVNWSAEKFYLWRNYNPALDQEFLMKNKLVEWQGREVLLALAVDVSNDKSLVDSLDTTVMGVHSALGGVQRMSEARTLVQALNSALETIGSFFFADTVRFWRRCDASEPYSCIHVWAKDELATLGGLELTAVSDWLDMREHKEYIVLESPEALLSESLGMYRHLKDRSIRNQHWMQVKDKDEELGYISIDNVARNFQNTLFLESFSTFFATELKKRFLTEDALHSARHDDLTNLLSRRSFEEYLTTYNADEVFSVGVVLLNFNNLKGINGTRGFQTGNYYLRQLADVLAGSFADYDTYRLNGDEFLTIARNIGQAELAIAVREVEHSVREIGSFSVAIGYSWDDVENDLRTLIDQATQVMQANKTLYYDTAADAEAAERRKMLSELMAEIEVGHFLVHFQPKVEFEFRQVMGAEALVRYCSEKTGIVLPTQFIGMLEENNLIRYVDLFVLEEVCRQLACWKKQGLFLPVISLNFSRLTLLERDIVSSVEAIVSRYGVEKSHIEIEITESIADIGKNILCQTARDLYEAGYAISLDDFGTKYTNLSMLADIDFGVLKLDKSLVGALASRENYQAILKNVIRMCKDLFIDVIAEGVETREQEEILRKLECKLGQGFLYGRPMPALEFEQTYLMSTRV